MAVIFPDVELLLVGYLNSALVAQDTALASNVRVASKVAPPELTRPAKQVVVNASYFQEFNFVLKRATVTLDVYAMNYADATNLGLLVEALIREATGNEIKAVTVLLGPVRTTEDTDYERRSLDIEVIVKGTNL